MSVLMPERVQEQVIIQIEQNPVQDALDRMIGEVEASKWCRNSQYSNEGRRCALGMIRKQSLSIMNARTDPYVPELLASLYEAIPKKDLQDLITAEPVINGGFNYISLKSIEDIVSAVASYNNTRKDEQEIIEWFERAKLLA